jgi:ABC-type molybdate transport system substrate-binding protein
MSSFSRWLGTGFALILSCGLNSAHAENPTLFAAGSLKAAMGDVVEAYAATYGTEVDTRFGPSGLLRQAIEEGARPDVFASANMAHPGKLAAAGWGSPVALFARNQLCGLAQPGLSVSSDTLLDVLLDPEVRVGTSTPKADPSGDYAWQLFERAEAVRTGSLAALDQKALQLTGGPDSAKPPAGRNQYAWVMDEQRADIFLTYCTNAVLAQRELPDLQVLSIPANLAVGADYGLIVRADSAPEGWRLALFILSPQGQEILAGYGFAAAAVPR